MKINKNSKKDNKNVFTGDKDTSGKMIIQSLPGDNVMNKKNKKPKSKSKDKAEELNKTQKSNDSSKNILEQIEITKQLNILLDKKKSELEKLKGDVVKEIKDINNEIEEKNIKIDSMTKNTSLLINELTNISEDVDSKYSKHNIVKEIDKKKAKMAENKNI